MKRIETHLPWAVSIIIAILTSIMCPNILKSRNIESALNAVITTAALIIGFIGAVLPVLMSLKNESPLVSYIFKHDKANLFYKYTRSTIFSGILLIVISIIAFFHDLYDHPLISAVLSFVLTFVLFLFIANALRCLLFMLKVTLGYTNNKLDQIDSFKEKSSAELNFINHLNQQKSQ